MLDPKKVNNDLMLLSPYFRYRIERAIKELHENGHDLFIFEGFRSPQRSNYLYEQGRTREGKIVTKAKAWQSLHNYSVACDIWPKINNRWVFEFDYKEAASIMKKHGFTCGIEWGDSAHFQLDGGFTWRECKAITESHGLPVLWKCIEERIISKNEKIG
jgi:peptidoglycan L-alanyl-D-glutamate endopeptidase CwlK